MIVNISDKYRITTDPLQYMIQVNKASKNKREAGQHNWSSMGYYTNLSAAVNGLIELDLRAVALKSLSDAVERHKAPVQEIVSALLPQYQVISNHTCAELITAAEKKAEEVVPVGILQTTMLRNGRTQINPQPLPRVLPNRVIVIWGS